jgi:hypothetical protein
MPVPYGSRAARADLARHEGEDARHLLAGEHDRQTLADLRPPDLLEPRQLEVDDFTIEEQQRMQRLAMRRRRDLALGGERSEEPLDLGAADFARMTYAGPSDEEPNPSHMGLLGAQAAVHVPDALAHLV